MKGILFWNGVFGESFSGGDKHFAKFIEYSTENNKIVCSRNAKKIIENPQGKFVITDEGKEKNILSKAFTIANRILITIIYGRKEKYDYSLTSSPFLFDTIPMAFSNSKVKIANIFHVVPKRKAVNFNTGIRFKIAELEKLISFFIIKKYANIILTGNSIEKAKLEKIFPNKTVLIEHAGIDTKKIDLYTHGIQKKNQAVFAGRLTSQKGIFDLIDITSRIIKDEKNFRIIILGEGPDKDKFIKKIKDNNLTKNIIIKGFVSEKEKYELLLESKFFFFPSYEEGWGISLAEALYSKCICFCYELPHYREIFSEFPIYIKKGDKKMFYAKFIKFDKKINLEKQKEFIGKYDFKQVIRNLESQFNLFR